MLKYIADGFGFIIPNNYDHSIAAFKKLFDEATKSFPSLTGEMVECRTVVASGHCKGCPIIRFPIAEHWLENADGWKICKNGLPDISWR
jgi:hypothetical protein